MIISISGKKQSGKDLIGKIIQYLYTHREKENLDDLIPIIAERLSKNYRYCNSEFHIKKFADTLKDIICILINCTREQLEDENFKNTELGEDWRIWKFVLDKDANLFDGMCQLTDTTVFASKEDAEDYVKEHKIINVLDIKSEVLTPRKLLQLLGTEAGRNILHPNIWINSLMSKYKAESNIRVEILDTYPKWVITDVRFINEVEAIQKRKGLIIRINRDIDKIYPIEWKAFFNSSQKKYNEKTFIKWLLTSKIEKYKKLGKLLTHDSEILLDDFQGFDYVIDNNGTIEDLIKQVKLILIEEKIL